MPVVRVCFEFRLSGVRFCTRIGLDQDIHSLDLGIMVNSELRSNSEV